MRKQFLFAVMLLALSSARADSSASHENALKALAANDYTTALSEFEAALASDADNIQYASEYRQAVIKANAYDRGIKFFEKLVADNPKSSNAELNFGFAYVDKIPAAGTITQVILPTLRSRTSPSPSNSSPVGSATTRAATVISSGRKSSAGPHSDWPTWSRR